MAQTRRKRQTKHRGNAAGVVESRGRTGRKPTAAEKTGPVKVSAAARARSLDKRDQPPTWKGAFYKAMIATVLLLLITIFLLKNSNSAIALFPIVLVGYTVISYYTDKWVYDRRQRKKAREGKASANLKGTK
jgi:uncharacterized integral membrane protein